MDTAKSKRLTLSEHVAREIRAEMGRQQVRNAGLAELLGVSEMWVSRKLRGITPLTLAEVEQLAEVLEVEVSALLPTGQRTSLPKPTVPDRGMRAAHLATAGCTNRPTPVAPNLTTTDTSIRRPVIRLGRHGGVTA